MTAQLKSFTKMESLRSNVELSTPFNLLYLTKLLYFNKVAYMSKGMNKNTTIETIKRVQNIGPKIDW